jgi:excisionase family DNA binding protein
LICGGSCCLVIGLILGFLRCVVGFILRIVSLLWLTTEGTKITEITRLNSVKDVVHKTRLSRSKVYEEMEAGRLKSVKVGRRRLIPESALVDYVNNLIEAAMPGGRTK